MSNAQTTIELNKFIKKFNSDLKKFLPKNVIPAHDGLTIKL